LNYYLKFVKYYKETSTPSVPGNIFLKGAHSFEATALSLLKDCGYDINSAFRKILFPVLDLIYEDSGCSSPPNFNSKINFKILKYLNLAFGKKIPAPSSDPMIYVNSALNDLIGSNIQEKEAWLEYIKERIGTGIDSSELQVLLDLGGKMKIDIPDFVVTEVENSMAFAHTIRRHLNEKNSINEIINLLEQSKNFKVKTEEFYQLEDVLKKAKNWISKVEELQNKSINYKTLQTLYQESKTLPINFENFENIKSRYLKAQKWQEKYSQLPKHSKTRGQGNNNTKRGRDTSNNERCTIAYLQQLIKECDDINFTSNDVVSLKSNFDKLREAEAKILMTLEDNKIVKTRELLNEFIGTLDSLKFTTELYDQVANKLEYLIWEEKKNYYMNTKILKMKHLRSLMKEANKKNLCSIQEIQDFCVTLAKIETWMDKMSNIFYNINSGPNNELNNSKDDDESLNDDEVVIVKSSIPERRGRDTSLSNSNLKEREVVIDYEKKKIEMSDLKTLYDEGKSFTMKPEEVEHLLMKCEEFFEFINECKSATNVVIKNKSEENLKFGSYSSNSDSTLTTSETLKYDYQKLANLRKQISKYNIKCDEFDVIDNQMNMVQKWMECYEDFINKFNKLGEEFPFDFPKIETLENRQETIEILETYVRRNSTFYEDLAALILQVPQFARKSSEFEKLQEIKTEADSFMQYTRFNSNYFSDEPHDSEYKINPQFIELDELLKFINKAHLLSISREYFSKLLCIFRAKSWTQMSYLKEKMSLHEADMLIKEANSINFHGGEMEDLKNQIVRTKEWVKHSKKLVNSKDKIKYEVLKTFINEGTDLPLNTPELQDLIQFQVMLEDEMFKAQRFLQTIHPFSELQEYFENIEQYPIDNIVEFEIIITLFKMCAQWKIIAEKILGSRKLSKLFFKGSPQIIKNNSSNNINLTCQCEEEEDSKVSCSHKCSNGTPQKTYDNCTEISENDEGRNSNTNINIVNNNYYFGGQNDNEDEISTSNNISKKKQKKASKQNYDNVLNMINNFQTKGKKSKGNVHNQTSPKRKKNATINGQSSNSDSYLVFTAESKINSKKFESCPYEDQLKILSRTIILKEEDPSEKYCICRRGDDSLHYMLMCENCKEWFHGKCLKINKSNADKISQYLCVACSRRKDIFSQAHHHEFFNLKRISYEKFYEFFDEGMGLPVIFDELPALKIVHEKILVWINNYETLLHEIISFVSKLPANNPYKIFDDAIEKSLLDLYQESEGFPVDLEGATNIIIILKHYDWFKVACKCLENKKISEKNYKKIVCSSYSIFNREAITITTPMESNYFNLIIDKGLRLLSAISGNFDKFSSIFSELKGKYDKKYLDVVEELIHQYENAPQSDKLKNKEIIINECEKYIKWENNMRLAFNSPSSFEENFNRLLEEAKTFNFKSALLEKFRRISQNPIKEQVDYYRCLLWDDYSALKTNLNNNWAKSKKTKDSINSFNEMQVDSNQD
jgi:hypothetical protein